MHIISVNTQGRKPDVAGILRDFGDEPAILCIQETGTGIGEVVDFKDQEFKQVFYPREGNYTWRGIYYGWQASEIGNIRCSLQILATRTAGVSAFDARYKDVKQKGILRPLLIAILGEGTASRLVATTHVKSGGKKGTIDDLCFHCANLNAAARRRRWLLFGDMNVAPERLGLAGSAAGGGAPVSGVLSGEIGSPVYCFPFGQTHVGGGELDYMLSSTDLKINKVKVIGTTGSDHMTVFVDLLY